MHRIGDRVIYGIHGVCLISDQCYQTINKEKVQFYVLEPVNQPGDKIYVPMNNASATSKLRPLLSRSELIATLEHIDFTQCSWIEDENQRKQCYRQLIGSGDLEELLRMIHALSEHKLTLDATGRKAHICDENFYRDVKKLLDTELSEILDIPSETVAPYVLNLISQ